MNAERQSSLKLQAENEALRIQLESALRIKIAQDRKIVHLHHILQTHGLAQSPSPTDGPVVEEMDAARLLMDIAGSTSPTSFNGGDVDQDTEGENDFTERDLVKSEVKRVVDDLIKRVIEPGYLGPMEMTQIPLTIAQPIPKLPEVSQVPILHIPVPAKLPEVSQVPILHVPVPVHHALPTPTSTPSVSKAPSPAPSEVPLVNAVNVAKSFYAVNTMDMDMDASNI